MLFRFGKILWGRLPKDIVTAKIDLEEFAKLVFCGGVDHSQVFNAEYVNLIIVAKPYMAI